MLRTKTFEVLQSAYRPHPSNDLNQSPLIPQLDSMPAGHDSSKAPTRSHQRFVREQHLGTLSLDERYRAGQQKQHRNAGNEHRIP